MAVVCERRVGRYFLLARARRRETFRKREIRRDGRATERSENLGGDVDEDRVAFGSWKREQNESRGAARKEVGGGVNGVVDLCICVYTPGRGGGRREERVNLSVGAALPRGDPHSRPRFYCFQPRRYTKLLVLSAR